MTGRSALGLAVASVAAGALNYLYQVHAASVLDATAFGLLSTWLARVTLVGTVATVVQFLSLDFAIAETRFNGILRLFGALSLVTLGAHLFLGNAMSTTLLGVLAVGSGIVLYAIIGQLQARLQLGVVAAAGVVTAAVRFALPFAWSHDGRAPAFYVAQSAAAFAGIVAGAAVLTLVRPRRTEAPAEAPVKERRLRLGRPILLAFATVLFPLLDVLVISSIQDSATTGAFSRIALASRIVFFGGAAALQILLPHELHAAASGAPLPPFALRLQRWLTPGMIGGAIVLAALADPLVLRPEGDPRLWLYASCLSAAFLVAILGHVNRFAAHDRLGAALATIAGVVATSAVAAGVALGSDRPVTRYTLGILVGDAVVLLLARAAQMRSRPSASLG